MAAFKVLPSVSLFTCELKWPFLCPWALLDPLWIAVSFFSSPPSSQLCIKWLLPLWALLRLQFLIQQSVLFLLCDGSWNGLGCCSLLFLFTAYFWCLALHLSLDSKLLERCFMLYDLCITDHFVNTASPIPTCSVNLPMSRYWHVLPCVMNLAPWVPGSEGAGKGKGGESLETLVLWSQKTERKWEKGSWTLAHLSAVWLREGISFC